MFRAVITAIVASAATLAAAGVQAQPTNAYYVATPVAQPAKARLITRSTAWQLKDGAFVAARAAERDTILCQLLARDVGGLSAFSAGGKTFDAAQLDTCNAKAGIAAPTMAQN
ncbi:CC_3452 family protein [Sphingomonas adhaesiva]|uniref:CC_3452 family protein n=1 Tax=Sphingomonas adhaesiva TaxID=28212 RepID=UPI002FF67799